METVIAPRPGVASGILPFAYLESFFESLRRSGRVGFKSYADLPFDHEREIHSDEDLKELYLDERAAYKRQKQQDGALDVLLLHDCDSGPEETVFLCSFEAVHGIRSTTSLFANVLDRSGNIVPYSIDYGALLPLQERGICYTYHCNGPEVCGYDESLIEDQINSDVDRLCELGFDIRFFSPHGGRVSVSGKNNNSYFFPPIFRRKLIWTHNRWGPFGARYSDGGMMPRLMRGDPGTDLREFVMRHAEKQERLFILLHPQYYFADAPPRDFLAQEGIPGWVQEFWQFHENGATMKFWEPMVERLVEARPIPTMT